MKEELLNNPVIFYDGNCGFCNSTVQFILQKRKKEFYFVPLQSNLGKELLETYNTTISMDTIYLLKDNKVYDKSSAALKIALGLRGIYPLLYIFYFLPKFLRDPFYNFIAKRRHRIRNNFCLIPRSEDQKYLIKD